MPETMFRKENTMLNTEQIKKIEKIVMNTCYEAKTVDLIDNTLLAIEEEIGTREYTTAYTLPSEVAKKDFGHTIRFMVFDKETKQVYDFSLVPRAEVMVEVTPTGE